MITLSPEQAEFLSLLAVTFGLGLFLISIVELFMD